MNRTCANCGWWNGSDRTCRRFPPQTWVSTATGGQCGFPSALPDWFCGEFVQNVQGIRMIRGGDEAPVEPEQPSEESDG